VSSCNPAVCVSLCTIESDPQCLVVRREQSSVVYLCFIDVLVDGSHNVVAAACGSVAAGHLLVPGVVLDVFLFEFEDWVM